mmetsp:Transcript_35452/g.69524  ORF Transcript_35452/g.69524 Transcript_35452/m.69524 type:complete len:198 (-) Transcript_35452:75-668(-)
MPWTDLLVAISPKELVAKLTQYWTAVGIVAALVSTMSYDAMFAAPSAHAGYDEHTSDLLLKWFSFLMGLAFLMAVTAVLLCTLFYAQLNQLPRDEDITVFLHQHQGKFGFCTLSFQLSVFLLLLGIFMFLIITFTHNAVAPWAFFFIAVCTCGGVVSWFKRMQKQGIDLQKLAVRDSLRLSGAPVPEDLQLPDKVDN